MRVWRAQALNERAALLPGLQAEAQALALEVASVTALEQEVKGLRQQLEVRALLVLAQAHVRPGLCTQAKGLLQQLLRRKAARPHTDTRTLSHLYTRTQEVCACTSVSTQTHWMRVLARLFVRTGTVGLCSRACLCKCAHKDDGSEAPGGLVVLPLLARSALFRS